jgi:AmmeMemoRadiSam system protein B
VIVRELPPRAGRGVRRPAVAGRFYPADPAQLTDLVDDLLASTATEGDGDPARAYVVPHAGYPFSGPTAAHAYARLRTQAGDVRRLVLIGPAHYVELHGCAVPAAAVWRTPLGDVPIDTDLADRLGRDGHVVVDDAPHEPEHSLEVQLPFVQRALPSPVPVLPIVVGPSCVDDVVATLTAAATPGTTVLCSTDLSHYLDDAAARRQDRRTVQAVLDMADERIGLRDACGVFALRGLVSWARHVGLRPTLLDLATSADTVGGPGRVVGYSAFAFHPATP